jgi:hypothetical protein
MSLQRTKPRQDKSMHAASPRAARNKAKAVLAQQRHHLVRQLDSKHRRLLRIQEHKDAVEKRRKNRKEVLLVEREGLSEDLGLEDEKLNGDEAKEPRFNAGIQQEELIEDTEETAPLSLDETGPLVRDCVTSKTVTSDTGAVEQQGIAANVETHAIKENDIVQEAESKHRPSLEDSNMLQNESQSDRSYAMLLPAPIEGDQLPETAALASQHFSRVVVATTGQTIAHVADEDRAPESSHTTDESALEVLDSAVQMALSTADSAVVKLPSDHSSPRTPLVATLAAQETQDERNADFDFPVRETTMNSDEEAAALLYLCSCLKRVVARIRRETQAVHKLQGVLRRRLCAFCHGHPLPAFLVIQSFLRAKACRTNLSKELMKDQDRKLGPATKVMQAHARRKQLHQDHLFVKTAGQMLGAVVKRRLLRKAYKAQCKERWRVRTKQDLVIQNKGVSCSSLDLNLRLLDQWAKLKNQYENMPTFHAPSTWGAAPEHHRVQRRR